MTPPEFVDTGGALLLFRDIVYGACVAFGQIAAPGVSATFSITGGATAYLHGGWASPPYVVIDRSTNGGSTWTLASGGWDIRGPRPWNVAAEGCLSHTPLTGTAIYRVSLAAPVQGGPLLWGVYQ